MKTKDKLLVRALNGEKTERPAVWMMRQAGRYLPEYRQIRRKVGDFLDLCYDPRLATEIALQPIKRFGLDASILFSDILVIPHALGQKIWFQESEGPKLEELEGPDDIGLLRLDKLHSHLAPIYETTKRLRQELPKETALIGFSGAPWTLISYMIEGGSSKDYTKSKRWALCDPISFKSLTNLLVTAISGYLIEQVDCGAEVLQIFDSWAGVWSENQLRQWCLEPCKEIIAKVKEKHPTVPIILFPRMIGASYKTFALESGANALGIDTTVPLSWIRNEIQPHVTVQGNLDPVALVAGGKALEQEIEHILNHLSSGPFVFNLGHGIIPQTPVGHVEAMLKQVRGF